MKKLDKPINVTKSFLPPFDEYVKEIEAIWNTNWMTNNGPLHNELEERISSYLKVENSVLFTNGHLALDIAIKSLDLSGEVITTPFTFASTTHAIVMNNLKPVFCDINMNDYTIDTDKIESLITDKTTAILPVHVFGNPCNVEAIQNIARKHNLKVIYDSAHAFGVEIDGIGVGNFGDVSMFSLHATKVFNTIEGGLLTFNGSNLRKQFNLYKNFGITGPEDVVKVGLNAKMNEFQAAMGIVNLRYVNQEIENRRIITYRYRENLEDIMGINLLSDFQNIKHNYSYMPILIDEKETNITRDELYTELGKYNIFARKYFYPLTNDFECFKGKYSSCDTPIAKYVADRILTLPIYGSLSIEQVDMICETIRGIIHERK